MKTIDIDAVTGKETLRDMTQEEIANLESIKKMSLDKAAIEKKQEEAKLSALAKLAALGLTEDEVAAIVGN